MIIGLNPEKVPLFAAKSFYENQDRKNPPQNVFFADFEHTIPLGGWPLRFPGAISPDANITNRVSKLLRKMLKRPIGYSGLIRWELSGKIHSWAMSYLRFFTAGGNLIKSNAP